MRCGKKSFGPLTDRGPLRVMFTLTSMPVGGAETLLLDVLRRLEPDRFHPELVCLKQRGSLGEVAAKEFPVHAGLLRHKYDLRVLWRLKRLFRQRQVDAIVTVGAGDKMFWGRLAAWWEGVPVILAALHSTGWPDSVGRLNRGLTFLTDAFIAVAETHGRYLIEREALPADRVAVIPNGIDTERFCPRVTARQQVRSQLGIASSAPLCAIVAALRPEKNHRLFLQAADLVHAREPGVHFLVVGDGPERAQLENTTRELGLSECVHFLGSRDDIPHILAAADLFTLTSHVEASPISILEAMACGLPVVATRVGSVAETVQAGKTGFLVEAGDTGQIAAHWTELLRNPERTREMGARGREHVVAHASIARTVAGYQRLIEDVYQRKCGPAVRRNGHPLPLVGTTR